MNNDYGKILVEDIDELKNCIGLFTDFGLYVESRITQIVAKHKVLKDENKPDIDSNMSENEDKQTINVGASMNVETETIATTSENIPDIKIGKADEKPQSYDITKRKKYRKHREKDYDKNICDEHTPAVNDERKKTVSTVYQKKITFDC